MTEAQVWKDRYFKLRGLIQRIDSTTFIRKAELLLRLSSASQVKHQAQAFMAREILTALLLRGAVSYRQQDGGPDDETLQMSASVFAVVDQQALAELVKKAGERNLTIDAGTAGDAHGQDEPR